MAEIKVKSVKEAAKRLESLQSRMKRISAEGEAMVGHVLTSVIVGGTGFAAGYARARFDDPTVAGVPADLAGAVIAHGTAFLGAFGGADKYVHAVGDGLLASFGTVKGAELGAQHKDEANGGAVAGARRQRREMSASVSGGEGRVPARARSVEEIQAMVAQGTSRAA